ncbi:MAG: hypothetical protein H6738_18715 [Alphaproteobacteria bacterium]|nr:hypothetical protein [Alphaproteobacteria bacterium]
MLGTLIEGWRDTRDPAVAAAVVELGARLAADRSPPAGKTRKAVLAAWCAAAADADPVTLSVLLPTLGDGNSKEALARLEALAKTPPDPRIARALADLLAAPPFQAVSTKPFWKLAAAEIVRSGDPGVEALLAPIEGTFLTRLGGAETMAEVLEKLLATTRAELARIAVRPPSPALAAAVAEVAATRVDPIEAALQAVEKVPWAELEHAYGPAEDVPALLRALARGKPEERASALDALGGNVFHQGSVYDATPPVARFVVALVEAAHPDTAELLGYLACLAVNDPGQQSLAGGGDPWAGAKPVGEEAPFVLTAREVARIGPAVVRLIEHADPGIRLAASFLASFLPAVARPVATAAARQLHVERDERTLASLVLLLGQLHSAPVRKLVPEAGLVRDAAVLATARARPEALGGAEIADLRELGRSDRRVEDFPWFDGDLPRAARVIEEGLALDPPEALLDAVEQALLGDDPRAASDRIATARRRLFPEAWRPTPKFLRSDLDEHQLRFCHLLVDRADRLGDEYPYWAHTEMIGLFLTSTNLRRWLGRSPPGPMDERVADGRPAWKVMSDALYGHVTRQDALAALATLPEVVLADIVTEARTPSTTSWRPYELERHVKHVVEDAADPPTHRLDLELRHNDRLVDLLAELALLGGDVGWQAVSRLGQRQLDRIAEGHYAEGVTCSLAATTAVRRAGGTGEEPDDRVEAWLADTMTTAPVQRTPRRTEEVLRALPTDRAERMVLAHCPIWREGTITSNGRSHPTMFFDDTLRYARLLPHPPRAMTERVVAAIERHAEVKALTPRGEPGADPLPEEELLDWLRWAKSDAEPLLAAAIDGGSRAKTTLKRLAGLL